MQAKISYDHQDLERRLQMVAEHKLPAWDELPDGIRSREVCAFVNQTLQPLLAKSEELLTPAMLQNYLKLGYLPPMQGRKYNRMQISWLLTITLLKNVITINEVRQGIILQLKLVEAPEAYQILCEECEHAFAFIANSVADRDKHNLLTFPSFSLEPNRLAVAAACRALAFQIFTQLVLSIGGIAVELQKED